MNDTLDTATPLLVEQSIQGQLRSNDVDYYTLEFQEAGTLTAHLITPGGGTPTNIYWNTQIMNSDGDLLASKQTKGAGGQTLVSTHVESGIYYVRISSSYHNDAPYRLITHFTQSPSNQDDVDVQVWEQEGVPFNTSAMNLPLNHSIRGQLLANNDVDSYQVDLGSSGTLSAHFVAPGGGTPTRVYWLIQIYNENEDLLAQRTLQGAGGETTVSTHVVQAGQYVVKIKASYHTADPYSLTALFKEQVNPQVWEQEEYLEPQQTTPISVLPLDHLMRAQSASSSDVDWYQVEVISPGTLTAKAVFPGGGTPSRIYWFMRIYNDQNELLAQRSVLGGGGEKNISTGVSSGTYFIHIVPSYHNSMPYSIMALHQEQRVDQPLLQEQEPNSVFAADQTQREYLTLEHTLRGQLSSSSDIDIYPIEISTPGTLTLDAILPGGGTPSRIYWNIRLYSENQDVLAQESVLGSGGQIHLSTGLNAGLYYIHISGSYHIDQPYTLTTKFTELDQSFLLAWESETNNFRDDGDFLRPGQTILGQLSSSSDLDYYEVNLLEPGLLTVEATTTGGGTPSRTYWQLGVYDEEENLISQQTVGGAGALTVIDEYLNTGIYRIRVSPSYHNSIPYRLLVDYPQ